MTGWAKPELHYCVTATQVMSAPGTCHSLGCELGPDDQVLNQTLQRVWVACAVAGKPVGVHATDGATARRYRDYGCTLITTADDAAAITRNTAAQLGLARA
jgi:2-keto-3-deoxy-L-rhamnonate aldolase RhmA